MRDDLSYLGFGIMAFAGMTGLILGMCIGFAALVEWVVSLGLTYRNPYSGGVMTGLVLSVIALIGAFLVVAGSIDDEEGAEDA